MEFDMRTLPVTSGEGQPTQGVLVGGDQPFQNPVAPAAGPVIAPANATATRNATGMPYYPPGMQPPTNTPVLQHKPGEIFGPYVYHHPGSFDLNYLADGLYRRDRTFLPPTNDDVGVVEANAEEYVKLVRAAITDIPTGITAHQGLMRDKFIANVKRIEDRDILITEVAAEIVRAVMKLHTPSPQGSSEEDGLVEFDDGEMGEGRVPVPQQPEVIGDHFRPDQIEDIQPHVQDLRYTATARLDKICTVLLTTKGLAFDCLGGKDPIAVLVAAPGRCEEMKYPQQRDNQ